MGLVGSSLGPYELIALLGSGGMGEVYRARDPKLGRDVAIKILPASFATDPDRLARFEREARVLASLNHPNIATIHGVEERDGVIALVLELVEGETLADGIAKGRGQREQSNGLPLAEALAIARQIVDALDAAHERGIVHRDLKPANVLIRPDGTVKVLDFGLAKTTRPGGPSEASELTHSPTMIAPTVDGVLLGTAPYMSPEQARGQTVDKRTDIWAFACVLYEMLTGRRAFAGGTTTDTLAAIIEREPNWSALPTETPEAVCRLLRRSLEKDPKRRLRDIGDARHDLSASAERAVETSRIAASSPRVSRRDLAWSLAAVGVTVFAAGMLVLRNESKLPAPLVARTMIGLPASERVTARGGDYPLAVSPDGRRFAFVAETGGQAQLYVRQLDALEPRALEGTAGAQHPFFSPDGLWIGFFADRALQRVAVKGGAPLRICTLPASSVGGSWGSNNVIVFATLDGDLAKVDVAGGAPQPIPGSKPASWPQILPDGKTVLFTVGVGVGDAIATMSLDGGPKRVLARTSDSKADGPAVIGTGGYITQVRYVPSGHLVYGQDPGSIRAVAFNLRTLTVTGPPVSMLDGVERAGNAGAVYFAVSDTGSLLYAARGGRHQLVWVERNGSEAPVSPDRAAFRHPRLSPDGKRIAVAVYDETRHPFIWIYDVDRATKIPLNVAGLEPVWSPDNAHLAVGSDHGTIEEVAVNGTGAAKTLVSQGPFRWPSSWSSDGRQLLFYQNTSSGSDIWVLPFGMGRLPRALLTGPSSDFWGTFSPDGAWIAYVSTESGVAEVYARRFPDLADKVAISSGGGTRPRWSRDGRELFYRQGEAMMAVAVDASRSFSAGKPRRLFTGPYEGEGRDPAFDVTADGQRFLMIKTDPASMLQRLTLVQNWLEELKQRQGPE